MNKKAAFSATINPENTTDKYFPEKIEAKWQKKWKESRIYQPDMDSAKRLSASEKRTTTTTPFYNLMMFPYPSAEGMHVGNMYAFTGTDIYGRYKRMRGYSVFEPIGLDGFGIHSENYALKIGRHPMDQAQIAEKNFYRQLVATGNGYDWSRTVETYSPEYYRWTQWLFVQLFKQGLAYRKKSPVNFCPSCKTVLADEQVENGLCERCSTVVEKRELEQWFFRITKYAEQLLSNLDHIDWAEKVKVAQRQWIGKKAGINISYTVADSQEKIICFTTRPDTNFGATFIVLAPEHLLLPNIVSQEHQKAVEGYIKESVAKSDQERMQEKRKKTGIFTGSYAINSLNGDKLPIWVSDFVLGNVGTGAVVGVPGHDIRDFQFAQTFNLPIVRVVVGKDKDASSITDEKQVQEEAGTMVNSDFLNGMDIHAAKEKIMAFLEEKGWGKKVVTYHLRDWLISRQRYWGAPIPMVHCVACANEGKSWFTSKEFQLANNANKKNHSGNLKFEMENIAREAAGWYPVLESELPVTLPYIDDYKPLGTGKAPLANYPEFYKTVCPECGSEAMRETDVSDTFLDSSWYFLRYTSTEKTDVPFAKERVREWLPVDMYIGGAEHSVLHLLYSRFVTMVLYDMGLIDFDEPFKRFYAHGLLIKEGAKMSKSKGNVIIPDEYIQKYGADTLRTYLMFLGPYSTGGDFYDSGIEGIYKFLKRVWTLLVNTPIVTASPEANNLAMMHKTIKEMTEDLEALRYNTAIAKLMIYYNFLVKQKAVTKEEAEVLLQLLAPFAPHMTEELWQRLKVAKDSEEFGSIHVSRWPEYDGAKLLQDEIVIAIQVNGKLRDSIKIAKEGVADKTTVEDQAKEQPNVKRYIENQTVKNVIYVPGKIINFVL